MSTLEVNTIDSVSGTSNLTIGSGNSSQITLKSGATLTNFPEMTPAFHAYRSDAQSISQNTWTKVELNAEEFDSASAFDTSNNRFTPQTAGKYYCTFNINSNANGQGNFRIANAQIYFNGSLAYISGYDKATGYENNGRESLSAIITFNGSSDYIEPYFYGYTQDSGNIEIGGSNTYDCQFSAYRIIGL